MAQKIDLPNEREWKVGIGYFDSKTERVCGHKHGIQIDPIHPFSKGGPSTPDNLTLMCASHNKWKGSRLEQPFDPI